MMKTYKLLPVIGLLILMLSRCKEEEVRQPVEHDDSPAGQVKVLKVDALPGAVNISYSLPADEDIAYVEAKYQAKNGIVREGKSSYYKNTVMLEGFGDADNYEVKIYTVDKSENRSEPVTISVKPLLPDIMRAFETAELKDDFGGPNLQFANPSQASLAAVILYTDHAGDLVSYDTYYTKAKNGYYTARGLPPSPNIMGVYFRDRWNNLSDTLLKEITPIEEIKLENARIQPNFLTGDYTPTFWGSTFRRLFDGNPLLYGHTDDARPGQAYFTFTLGVTTKLSRFTLWQVPSNSGNPLMYSNGNPRKYELWGRASVPPADGSWDGWILLASCESIKPSGLGLNVYTDEDVAAANKGEEWNIPLDAPPVRYIRLKCLENWGTAKGWMHVGELAFWGGKPL